MRRDRETLQNATMSFALMLSGSLRADSSNGRLLRAAAALAPFATTFYEKLGELPHFNPDLDGEGAALPATVIELREVVQRASALVICTPEYAHGVPGSLKNALDWLVSSSAILDKPIAVLNASSRATHADASLRETLRTMAARIIDEASIVIALDGRKKMSVDEMSTDDGIASALREAMNALAQATGDLRQ